MISGAESRLDRDSGCAEGLDCGGMPDHMIGPPVVEAMDGHARR
jgi:hypothetical protein